MWDIEKLSSKYTQTQLQKLRDHQPCWSTCPVCSATFDAQSYVFRPTAIYPRTRLTCSDKCKRIYGGRKNKKVYRTYRCGGCGEFFTPHHRKPHQQYCSKKCWGIKQSSHPRPEVQKWIHKIVPPRGSISKQGIAWLDECNVPQREVLIRVNNKSYRVDGFDPASNTIYEYLGSFWHGNPEVYNPNDANPVTGTSFGELFKTTNERIDALREAGYNVITRWSER